MSWKGIEYSIIIKYNKKESGILALFWMMRANNMTNRLRICVAPLMEELKVPRMIWEKAEESVYNTIESAIAFDIKYLLQQLH